ncbi:phosphoglucomutase [Piromyces finnis]|uniref:Phosphoglucomutase n=1 Tax=Piromyces finnis TaxID=1754191 RepID=A0A1Y1VIK7_9FUNG|nr:phosphoglucomutase [Piromyces finnis]|eukprot:ORX56625.1 phosphoglucomutase [Piromyces finnis]
MTDIYSIAEKYFELEQDSSYKEFVQNLCNEKNEKELEALLRKPLAFGTAGLRAEMGPGFSRMNGLTVIQASQGLCSYLLETDPEVKTKGIVIGHDHRHHSESFARLTAAVFLSKGIRVVYYHKIVCTPLVPFTVSQYGASCGIMITASHNPKQYNGYKVYWSNACQIIPPIDKGIANKIKENQIPWIWDETMVDNIEYSNLVIDPYDEIIEKYKKCIGNLVKYKEDNSNTNVKFCYTAMHGVGLPFARKSFESFGFKPFEEVDEQVLPDPDFSTVEFPNPEEGKGVLDLSIAKANATGATVILANDPDADRLAIAEKQKDGKWFSFSGNQIGVILGAYTWEKFKDTDKKIAMVNSTVSTKMLEKIAKVENFRFEETLTGFKWIGNKAIDLIKEGYSVPFAFEEAIGFMCGEFIFDKDGISALAIVAELAAQLAKKNMTMFDYLNSLYDKYGYFMSNNYYFICHEQEVINAFFDNIRYGDEKQPSDDPFYDYKLNYPKEIANKKIINVRDLTINYDSSTPDHRALLPSSKSSQMITFRLDSNDCAITLRTSGTEPKIKYYIELSGKNKEDAEKELKNVFEGMIKTLNVHKYNL